MAKHGYYSKTIVKFGKVNLKNECKYGLNSVSLYCLFFIRLLKYA